MVAIKSKRIALSLYFKLEPLFLSSIPHRLRPQKMQIGNFIVNFSAAFAFIAGVFIIYITVDAGAKPLIIVTRNLTAAEYSYANSSLRNPVVTFGPLG